VVPKSLMSVGGGCAVAFDDHGSPLQFAELRQGVLDLFEA
jgi:hypothetical protein